MDIALALGGGGVRGFAHIGVLRCLEESGFRIRAIAGTSAGGMVGAVYAAGYSPSEIASTLIKVDPTTLFRRKSTDAPSLMGMTGMTNLLGQMLEDKAFEDLSLPFALTATDTISGREVVLHKGPVLPAVQATSAVPGVFPAVTLGDWLLIDGGVLDPVPVLIARWLAPKLPVVAVVLSQPAQRAYDQKSLPIPLPGPAQLTEQVARLRFAQAFNIFVRSVEITGDMLTESRLLIDQPDLILRPAVSQFGIMDKVDINEMIQYGEDAVQRALPELRQLASWTNVLRRRLKSRPHPEHHIFQTDDGSLEGQISPSQPAEEKSA